MDYLESVAETKIATKRDSKAEAREFLADSAAIISADLLYSYHQGEIFLNGFP